MAPAAASPLSSSSSSKPTGSSSRAVKIPHRTSHDDSSPSQNSNYRRRERHRKSFNPSDTNLQTHSSSESSSPSYSTSPATASHQNASAAVASSSSQSSSYSAALESIFTTPSSLTAPSTSKLKAVTVPTTRSSSFPAPPSSLGPTMHPSSSHSYRSVNLNSDDDPDSPPHLITYTRQGQGFSWNPELFLPSYMMGRHGHSGSRRRRRLDDDEMGDDDAINVAEIRVSEEEAREMMP